MKCEKCGAEMTFWSALNQLTPFRFKCSNCKTKYRAILPYMKIRTFVFCVLFVLLGVLLSIGTEVFGIVFLALFLLLMLVILIAEEFAMYRAISQKGKLVLIQPDTRRIAKIFGIVFIGIILIGIISHTVLNIYASIILEKEIQRKRESGQPVTIEDLATPPIPEWQNAVPLYQEAHQRLEKHAEMLTSTYAKVMNKDFSEWTLQEQETVRTIVAEHDQTFEIIHEAALRPQCWVNVVEFRQNLDFSFTHVLYVLTNLLALKAALDKADGDIEGGIDRIIDGFRVGQVATCIPGLTTFHLASDAMMLNRLEMLLDDAEVSKETYERLYIALEQQRESLTLGFAGESALHFDRFQEYMAEQSYLKQPVLKLQLVVWLQVFSEHSTQENQRIEISHKRGDKE